MKVHFYDQRWLVRLPPCGEDRWGKRTRDPNMVTCRACVRWLDKWVIGRVLDRE